MADQKITQLTEDTAPSSDDLVVTVNDPAGTPANRKLTIGNFNNYKIVTSGTRPGSPTEGMMIYETDTNLTLVHNGTVWVCVTPQTATVNAEQSLTTGSTWQDLATAGPSVTLLTSTTALVTISAQGYHSLAGGPMDIAVDVSGASTIAATYDNGSYVVGQISGYSFMLDRTFVLSGLTAGSNTFKLQYFRSSGTATYARRDITVTGIV